MRNSFFFISIVFLLLTCAESSHSDPGGTIKIGVIFAKTGSAAMVTSPGFKAARFAVHEVNRTGGISGNKIVLIEYDNKSTSLGSRFAAQQAVQDNVTGVIGPAFSSHALSVAKVLQKGMIPMITPTATNVRVTLVGDFIFRVCFVDTFQGRVAADFAKNDLNASTAVVLTNSSSNYSLGLANVFIKRFNLTKRVLLEDYYQKEMTDFTISLEKIIRLKPDVIFIPGHFRESAYIVKQARSMGIKSIFIGADGWVEKMYEYSGGAIDGSFYVDQWHQSVPLKENQAFVRRWPLEYGKVNKAIIALTYDAFYVFVNAVEKAKTINKIDIRYALSKTKNFLGVTGQISFDKNGDTINKSAVILKFDNGNTIFQKSINQ